ncbi:hypothetical protein F4859DRAFT_515402 [Xylaria cf. heliscus]|nr:hypothetical protein F4859DRAFT_515402 [Xylaria cf. heliscus]
MDPAGARRVGAGLLGEVEEGTLEELLDSLRANFTDNTSRHRSPHIPPALGELSAITTRYQRATQSAPPPLVSVSGRYLPFLYHLTSTLISPPHSYTVVIIDAEGKFDATRLISNTPDEKTNHPATPADLAHVHVYRPGRGAERVRAVLETLDEFMLYGDHASRGREWWGTVVVGGTGGHVNAGWKGWLRIDRENVAGFQVGISLEEAVRERERRQAAVDRAGWAANSRWGTYVWKDG